ncbi:hypothetical protein L6452_30743 [Arctium lappa]|uniref:Uncharacterized protein n=1 Tax=Arctium lappa TaxID=4217 RepID=A0ACB8ZJ78_ARCLA|nr:hypothetical protein L6452_30743 [Arctium lappa]
MFVLFFLLDAFVDVYWLILLVGLKYFAQESSYEVRPLVTRHRPRRHRRRPWPTSGSDPFGRCCRNRDVVGHFCVVTGRR